MLGIRVFERGTAAEEIVMDVEISYAGDARLKFSLQNIDCEINQVPGSTGAIQLLQLASSTPQSFPADPVPLAPPAPRVAEAAPAPADISAPPDT